MKKTIQSSQILMKTCSLCKKSSEAEGISLIHFGEWMSKKDISVHYYCLLLSTHLPQHGEDHSGILGFLLRDIRHEIAMAKNRKCMYCSEMSATIQCDTCKKYFHLTCGHTSKCLSHFKGEFKSYCHACVPVDEYLTKLFSRKPPKATELCFICTQMMGTSPKRWIYAKCCGNGFTHSKCMKIYALSAGYYLTCIWCKDKRFREDVKYFGVFVPDRDANWENEKGAYGDLYRRHNRCDMEYCLCPKGRDYVNAKKWQLIICKLCGAFGAHNPICLFESTREKLQEFKCDICSVTERTLLHKNISDPAEDLINTSLYVIKDATSEIVPTTSKSSFESHLSQETVFSNKHISPSTARNNSKLNTELESVQLVSAVYTLSQSPQVSQQLGTSESRTAKSEEQDLEDDDAIADLLVLKMLDKFDAYV